MEDEQNTLQFPSGWDLPILAFTVTNADDITGLTESFQPDERFRARISDRVNPMESLYGHQQSLFNQQCESICLTLLKVLIDTEGNLSTLTTAFEPCWANLRDAQEQDVAPLVPADIRDLVLNTLGATPVEIFFSYIGYYRHLLAAAAKPREDRWDDFGANRYLDYEPRPLSTPLKPTRYQPSVERARSGAAFEDYKAYVESRQEEGLRQKVNDNSLSQQDFEIQMEKNRARNQNLQSFKINKVFGGRSICFARVDKWSTLFDDAVDANDYREIYQYMDDLFVTLFGEDLLPAREFLAQVFRIQFWFIHLMPFHRGSAAAMSFFRFIMTAYYNYRTNGINRPMLPIAPPLMDYFPDLEALFLCRTDDDFVALSMNGIYCIDYNAYCD